MITSDEIAAWSAEEAGATEYTVRLRSDVGGCKEHRGSHLGGDRGTIPAGALVKTKMLPVGSDRVLVWGQGLWAWAHRDLLDLVEDEDRRRRLELLESEGPAHRAHVEGADVAVLFAEMRDLQSRRERDWLAGADEDLDDTQPLPVHQVPSNPLAVDLFTKTGDQNLDRRVAKLVEDARADERRRCVEEIAAWLELGSLLGSGSRALAEWIRERFAGEKELVEDG